MKKKPNLPTNILAKNGKWHLELKMHSPSQGIVKLKIIKTNKDYDGIIKIIDYEDNDITIQYAEILIDGFYFKYPNSGSEIFKLVQISSLEDVLSSMDIIDNS